MVSKRMSVLAGSAARKAAERLRSKVEEAEKPVVKEPTPRWRGHGFDGILAAALKAAAPKPKEQNEVIDDSGNPKPKAPTVDDAEKIADEEALQRVRQKRGMLQKRIVSAQQRCDETAREADKLQGEVSNLEVEVREVIGKRFAIEVKANDLENRVQETQAKHASLLQQASLDHSAFSRAADLQKLILDNVVGAQPTTSEHQDIQPTSNEHRRIRPLSGSRGSERSRPSSGSKRPTSAQSHTQKMHRPASSPAIGRRGALSAPTPKWLPAKHADAILGMADGIAQDLKSARKLHRESCPLLQQTAAVEEELHSREEGIQGLEKKVSHGDQALVNLKNSISSAHTEIQQMEVARQLKMINVRKWRHEITHLQEQNTEQEERVAASQVALEEQQIDAAAQAVQMQRPLESTKHQQENLKGEIKDNMAICSRRELEARHLNDWRLANAAQFKKQKELEDCRARRLHGANAHLQKQIWHAQDSSLSFSTQNRTLNVRM